MSYANRETNAMNADPVLINPPVNTITEYHDRVRWGPIVGGLVVAIATQLLLSAIGATLGFSTIAGSGAPRSDASEVGTAVGIWSILSVFIALCLGGWFTSRTSGPISKGSALLNGAILWASTLALGSYLLASGVSGAFGVAANNAGEVYQQAQEGNVKVPDRLPNVSADQTRDLAGNAAKTGWAFTLASLAGLGASLLGASIGVAKYRDDERVNTTAARS